MSVPLLSRSQLFVFSSTHCALPAYYQCHMCEGDDPVLGEP